MAGTRDIAPGPRDVEVSILFTEGCQSTPAAIRAIERVAAEIEISVQIRTVLIDSGEDAIRHRFLGSPTIRVNGKDIDMSARRVESFGLT